MTRNDLENIGYSASPMTAETASIMHRRKVINTIEYMAMKNEKAVWINKKWYFLQNDNTTNS